MTWRPGDPDRRVRNEPYAGRDQRAPASMRHRINRLAPWQKTIVALIAILPTSAGAYTALGTVETPWVSKIVYAADIKDLKARQDQTDLYVLQGHRYQLYGRILDLRNEQAKRPLSRPEVEYLQSLTDEYQETARRIRDLQQRVK